MNLRSSTAPSRPSLAAKALARLVARREAAKASSAPSGIPQKLVDYIPFRTPGYLRPYHLEPFLEAVELALRGVPQRIVMGGPPRHGKTEAVSNVPAFAADIGAPEKTIGFMTYGSRLTRKMVNKAREVLTRAGVALTTDTALELRNREGGGLLATSTTGALTGFGLDVAFIDDAVKTRAEAESPAYRARLVDWYEDVVSTRIEPGGSIFYVGTRWREDDLAGHLIKEKGFRYIAFPAISVVNGEERALWPERWPLATMQAKRDASHSYTWESLYQQNPRPRGTRVFDAPHHFTTRPETYTAAIGADLAYSEKKRADKSVAVEMRRSGSKFYIVKVEIRQVRAPEFQDVCHAMHLAAPTAPWLWYCSTTEKGVADLFAKPGPNRVPLVGQLAQGDKFTRALEYAAAWNRGDVLLPEPGAPGTKAWLDDLIAEHAGFTGSGTEHDDIVDACVAAFDQLNLPSGTVDSKVPQPTRVNAFDQIGM